MPRFTARFPSLMVNNCGGWYILPYNLRHLKSLLRMFIVLVCWELVRYTENLFLKPHLEGITPRRFFCATGGTYRFFDNSLSTILSIYINIYISRTAWPLWILYICWDVYSLHFHAYRISVPLNLVVFWIDFLRFLNIELPH